MATDITGVSSKQLLSISPGNLASLSIEQFLRVISAALPGGKFLPNQEIIAEFDIRYEAPSGETWIPRVTRQLETADYRQPRQEVDASGTTQVYPSDLAHLIIQFAQYIVANPRQFPEINQSAIEKWRGLADPDASTTLTRLARAEPAATQSGSRAWQIDEKFVVDQVLPDLMRSTVVVWQNAIAPVVAPGEREAERTAKLTTASTYLGDAPQQILRTQPIAATPIPPTTPRSTEGAASEPAAELTVRNLSALSTTERRARIQAIRYEANWVYHRAYFELFTALGITQQELDAHPELYVTLENTTTTTIAALSSHDLSLIFLSASKRQEVLNAVYTALRSDAAFSTHLAGVYIQHAQLLGAGGGSEPSAALQSFSEALQKTGLSVLDPIAAKEAKLQALPVNRTSASSATTVQAGELDLASTTSFDVQLQLTLQSAGIKIQAPNQNSVPYTNVRTLLESMALGFGDNQQYEDITGQARRTPDVATFLDKYIQNDVWLTQVFFSSLSPAPTPAQLNQIREQLRDLFTNYARLTVASVSLGTKTAQATAGILIDRNLASPTDSEEIRKAADETQESLAGITKLVATYGAATTARAANQRGSKNPDQAEKQVDSDFIHNKPERTPGNTEAVTKYIHQMAQLWANLPIEYQYLAYQLSGRQINAPIDGDQLQFDGNIFFSITLDKLFRTAKDRGLHKLARQHDLAHEQIKRDLMIRGVALSADVVEEIYEAMRQRDISDNKQVLELPPELLARLDLDALQPSLYDMAYVADPDSYVEFYEASPDEVVGPSFEVSEGDDEGELLGDTEPEIDEAGEFDSGAADQPAEAPAGTTGSRSKRARRRPSRARRRVSEKARSVAKERVKRVGKKVASKARNAALAQMAGRVASVLGPVGLVLGGAVTVLSDPELRKKVAAALALFLGVIIKALGTIGGAIGAVLGGVAGFVLGAGSPIAVAAGAIGGALIGSQFAPAPWASVFGGGGSVYAPPTLGPASGAMSTTGGVGSAATPGAAGSAALPGSSAASGSAALSTSAPAPSFAGYSSPGATSAATSAAGTTAMGTGAATAATTATALATLGPLGLVVMATPLSMILISIYTIFVIFAAFLAPLPIGDSTGNNPQQSEYLTLYKQVTPKNIANNPTDAQVEYQISIRPRSGYRIRVTNITDSISYLPSSAAKPALTPPEAPISAADLPAEGFTTTQQLKYTLNLTGGSDVIMRNSATIVYDVLRGSSEEVVASAQTLKASANLRIGSPKVNCWPTSGTIVQLPNGTYTHLGTDSYDIVNSIGTKIFAPIAGRLVAPPFDSDGYGRYVVLHFTLNGQNYRLIFGHLSRIEIQNLPAEVSPGDLIGRMGSTGNSDAPHLHYELRPASLPPATGLRLSELLPPEDVPVRLHQRVATCF